MKNIVLILQARMGSTRLPGKSMMDLAGAPLVGRILERVAHCKKITKTILATTTLPDDDVLEDLATLYGVSCFRGSVDDLVDRYYQAALTYGADIIVRLPADNPCPEPGEIDRIVDYHLKGMCDFSTNLAPAMNNGYPDGIGAEVFDFKSLKEIRRHETDPARREHLHLNFYDYQTQQPTQPDKYLVGSIPCPRAFRFPDLVLDVNTEEEYRRMVEIYEALYIPGELFSVVEIVEWMRNTIEEEVI